MFGKLENSLSQKNIYIVSVVGFILGAVLYNLIRLLVLSMGLNIDPLYVHMIFGFLISYAYSKYVDSKTQKIPELTPEELRSVLLSLGLFPIIAGLVYFYSWKKLWPLKANKANKFGWIFFTIGLLLGIGQFFVLYFIK